MKKFHSLVINSPEKYDTEKSIPDLQKELGNSLHFYAVVEIMFVSIDLALITDIYLTDAVLILLHDISNCIQ